MRLTARKLVLELVSAMPARLPGMPIRALVRGGAVFGLADNSVRVAVTRLCREGRLDSPERGVYNLGPRARPMHERVVSWRRLDDLIAPWAGAWFGVMTGVVPRSDRPAMRSQERALALWGFRELSPGFALRPANLTLGTDALREQLYALGVDARAPVVRVDELGPHRAAAMALWDNDDPTAAYRALVSRLDDSAARLDAMPLADAVRESYLLGREVLRALIRDPLLPEPMASPDERQRLLDTMRDYDERARALWARFLIDDAQQEAA